MKQVVRTVLVACLAVSIGASSLAAQLPGVSPADSKELASYRLSMDTATKVHNAMKSLIVEAKKDPKVQALMKTEAAIEALEKKEELTDAESERLDKLREERDQQKEIVEETVFGGADAGKGDSLDAIEAEIKSHPVAAAALNSAGVSPREYARFMMSAVMAGLVAGFQQSGVMKELPKELQGIPAENIKFMQEHGAELEQMQKELAALSKGMS